SYYSNVMYTIKGGYTIQLYLHFPDAVNAQLHYVVVSAPGADKGFHLGTVEGKAVTTVVCHVNESNSKKYEQDGLAQKLGEAAMIATLPIEEVL
ncbi:hypothetical protein, partial [Salmonella sp. s51228]|uniref:hypothetical protein n=1 Tax=Salmonella sp. s51228 TaxID=3159652 RepID=UPI00397EF762